MFSARSSCLQSSHSIMPQLELPNQNQGQPHTEYTEVVLPQGYKHMDYSSQAILIQEQLGHSLDMESYERRGGTGIARKRVFPPGTLLTFPVWNVLPNPHFLDQLQEYLVLFWAPLTLLEFLVGGLELLQALESCALCLESTGKQRGGVRRGRGCVRGKRRHRWSSYPR